MNTDNPIFVFIMAVMLISLLIGLNIVETAPEDGSIAEVQPSNSSDKFSTICIDGVVYLYVRNTYRSVLSVKYNPDSTVVQCGPSDQSPIVVY